MPYEACGYHFEHVCDITPFADDSGKPIELHPQSRYENVRSLPLHAFGEGPFCEFRIPRSANGRRGVYVLLVDGSPAYVGQCEDLGRRYNAGYGNISPRACYHHGQPTNCRINTLVLTAFGDGKCVALHFHETNELDDVEGRLIRRLNPPWNRTLSMASQGRHRRTPTKAGAKRPERAVDVMAGKYAPLARYFAARNDRRITLSFEQMEGIIGSPLPRSAHNYRAWWANSGQPHSPVWTVAGYSVTEVVFSKYVVFQRTEG